MSLQSLIRQIRTYAARYNGGADLLLLLTVEQDDDATRWRIQRGAQERDYLRHLRTPDRSHNGRYFFRVESA